MDNKPKYETKTALSKMMAICSRGEKAISDIEEKLRNWNIASSDINYIIDELIKENFLNEERFCTAYVRDKLRFNHWGKIKIRFMLSGKNIAKSLQEKILSEINPNEYLEIIISELKSKLRGNPIPTDYNEKMKIVASLSRKGFESELIFKGLSEIGKEYK